MGPDSVALRHVLRTQLTAVNQQFVHVLALRVWGEDEFAAAVQKIDNIDFPVSMKIMNHLVEKEVPHELEFAGFSPGDDVAAVVAAEREVEARMADALSVELDRDDPTAAWITAARKPRPDYASWLEAKGAAVRRNEDGALGFEPADRVFSALVAWLEQAMAHAFIHRHRGTPLDADIAWATSGVAMTKSSVLVRAMAQLGCTPKARAGTGIRIQERPEAAREQDRHLAEVCARVAGEAAEGLTGKLSRFSRDIKAFAIRVANHDGSGQHPSQAVTSPAFSSFEATIGRFVA